MDSGPSAHYRTTLMVVSDADMQEAVPKGAASRVDWIKPTAGSMFPSVPSGAPQVE